MYQSDMSCRICKDPESYEDEIHTFSCKVLTDGLEIDEDVKFLDIYGDLTRQVQTIKSLMKIIRKRNLLLDLDPSYDGPIAPLRVAAS